MLSEESNRALHAGRPRHADGRAAAALLDAHRRRRRARRHAGEAGAAPRRGPRALQGPRRALRPRRPALRASPRRPVLRLGRGLRAALPLSRLAVGSRRPVSRAALRGDRASRGALQGPRADQGLSGRGQGGPRVGLPRAGAGAARADVGALHLARTASCRSSSPRSRATGSSARRTRSTPCTSSGCTRNWARVAQGHAAIEPPTHLKIGFDEFEYGFTYRRVLEGQSEDRRAVDGGAHLPLAELPVHRRPLRVARARSTTTNTLSVGWFFDRVPNEMEPFAQDRIPYWYGADQGRETGRWITSHVMNQDFIAWMGQGTIADRTAGASGRERPRRHPDAQAPARGGPRRGPRRRAQGGDARSGAERLRASCPSSAASTSSRATPERTATSGASARRDSSSERSSPS